MAKKKETVKKETVVTEEKTVAVQIKWNVPDTIVTRVATNMVCQIIEGYIKLMFFETKPDILLTQTTTIPTEINADCVASVVICPDKIPAIIKVLEAQLQKYQARPQFPSIIVSSESEQPL